MNPLKVKAQENEKNQNKLLHRGFKNTTYEHMHGLLRSNNLLFSKKLCPKFLHNAYLAGYESILCSSAKYKYEDLINMCQDT